MYLDVPYWLQIYPAQYANLKSIPCPLVPGLNVVQTKEGKVAVNAVSAMMVLCEKDNNSAKTAWCQFSKAHPCMKPTTDLVDASEVAEFSYTYVSDHGRTNTALSISPGLEYLCQHKGGTKAAANKEKFLQLIHSFKQQQAAPTGSNLGKRAGADDSLDTPYDSQAIIKIQRVLDVSLDNTVARVNSTVKGAVTSINTEIKNVGDGVLKVSEKFTGVEEKQTELKNDFGRVSSEFKKANQIAKYYHEQLVLSNAANERQRYIISELNKKLDVLQRNPTSSTANELIIIEELKTVKQANAALETKVAEMHAMLTTIIGVMMP